MRTYREFEPTFGDRRCWTLPWILRERARTHGDRVFMDVPWEGRSFTYAQMLDGATRIATGLLAAGCETGDRAVIMAPNSPDYVLAWFGSALAGMAEVPLNTAYEGTFLEHQVRTTRPRVVVVDPALAPRFLDGGDAYASIERFYVLPGERRDEAIALVRASGRAADPFDVLKETAPGDGLPEVDYRDLAAIFFTSGTTGLSKGVMMSHSHLAFFADQGRAMTRLTDADTYMSVGPLFHGNAQFLAAYPALMVGARFVLQQRFSASRWIDQIRDAGATVTNFVGVMTDFVHKQPARPDDADNALRCIYAVPTPDSIAVAFKERFGVEALLESFGSTEASLPIVTPYGQERPAGAAGVLLDEWFDVRIVDPETDEELPVGEVGELLVRSHVPWTMLSGYYGMPDRTAEALRNQWFHTGDAVRRDADGWFYFVDRLKDAIRRRGENISSYEVEQAVLAHPDIVDCAAVAVPAGVEAGEDNVALFVVVAGEAAIDEADVREWCDHRLPVFARPSLITLVGELPYTPSGKVRKVELRELLAARA
ncbi:MAG: carnitine-CoA ligase [Thermoleophilales bacterium]|nr:carnitine-CoA ligase [Thermoleophilales bacterium]